VRCIEPANLETAVIPAGTERLLIRTANSAEWATLGRGEPLAFRQDYVALSPAAARWVVDRGIRLLGVDYVSAGPWGATNRETHLMLLGNDVLIVETLDLSAIVPGPYTLVCLPLKLAIGGSAPARVLLMRER
jgi:arylformamidase